MFHLILLFLRFSTSPIPILFFYPKNSLMFCLLLAIFSAGMEHVLCQHSRIDPAGLSTLFCLAAGLLTWILRKYPARVPRHWLWFAASVKFLIPFLIAPWHWQLSGVDAEFGGNG